MEIISWCRFQALFFVFVMSRGAYSMEESTSKSNNDFKAEVANLFANLDLKNFEADASPVTDLNNLPYELKLYISHFLPVYYQDIGILVKKIYQLANISREWKNVVAGEDIWKIVFRKFFKNILLRTTFKKAEDIQEINIMLEESKAIIESIKLAVTQKGGTPRRLNQNIIETMSNAFYCVQQEVELNLSLEEALNMNSMPKFKLLLEEAKGDEEILNIWNTLLLVEASKRNFLVAVRLLLDKNCDVNYQTKDLDTPLIGAAYEGHKEIVEILLQCNSIKIDAKNCLGRTALMYPCERGRKDVVKILLDNGADVNAQDLSGKTPLIWAIFGKHLDIVQMLLEYNYNNGKRINPNIQDKEGNTALIYAVKMLDMPPHQNVIIGKRIIELLLNHNANFNIKDKYGRTALYIASDYQQEEIVATLLANAWDRNIHINIEAKSIYDITPLLIAVERGDQKIINMLEEYSKKINETGPNINDLPVELIIHVAKFFSNQDMKSSIKEIFKLAVLNREWHQVFSDVFSWKIIFVQYFKKLLLKFDYMKSEEFARLHQILVNNSLVIKDVNDLCKRKNINQNLTTAMIDGFKVVKDQAELNYMLHHAISNCDLVKLKKVFEAAQAPAIDKKMGIWSNLLLIHVIERLLELKLDDDEIKIINFIDIIKLLLKNNCDLSLKNKIGQTPLILAALTGNEEVFELILNNGRILANTDAPWANINSRDNHGWSALMFVAQKGYAKIVKRLLENGGGRAPSSNKVNIDAKNSNGDTALIIAARESNLEIVRILLEHGANIEAKNNLGETALIGAFLSTKNNFNKLEIAKLLIANGANFDAWYNLAQMLKSEKI